MSAFPIGRRAQRGIWQARYLAIVLVGFLAIAAAGGLAAALTGGSNNHAGAVSRSGLRAIGPAPANQELSFVFVLRLPGQARLQGLLGAMENPRSPLFHRFIDPKSFGARFGISGMQLDALERIARTDGLSVLDTYPQRTELGVRGTVAAIGRLLRVRIVSYRDRAGHYFHAPVGRPVIPRTLRSTVESVAGLDTRPRFIPHDVPMGGLTPSEAATAYDVRALHAAGINGQGQRIAVISFSAFDQSDPATFASHYGISGPPPVVVPVDGGTSDTSGADEADLDIDVIRAIAPAAEVLVYEAPQSSSSYGDLINRIVADHNADIISSSWGQCELGLDPGERLGGSRALTAAIANGVSMFVATGDSGAYDCQQADLADHRLSVDWPAASADAVAVGGTRLYVGADGSYQGEAGWEDQLSAAGGGGGFTTGDARPPWQTGPGILGAFSTGHRQLPDVVADADPGTGWSFVTNGQLGEAGGTSAATPFWAASMVLIRQYATERGVARLGFVDPALYALAASRQPFPPFHDVSRGGNRFYQAGSGWDPATGLGSPDVYNLARDMVAYLRTHGAR